MDFGIFNPMGYRHPAKTSAEVFAGQTWLASELGHGIAWFAEDDLPNCSACASPLSMVADRMPIARRNRLGIVVVGLPPGNTAYLSQEIGVGDRLPNGRSALGIGLDCQLFQFERFGVDVAGNIEASGELTDIIDCIETC
jgi:alkanesulfonate monooxygenase SsuD/methylene tetrahydromethanopterin reductase-like flavin-dependent oxidoreductase (luciferase family)